MAIKNETPVPEPEPGPGPDPTPELSATKQLLTDLIAKELRAQKNAAVMGTSELAIAVAAGVKAAMDGQAELHASAMKRALKPENDPAPMESVYNPKGDRDFPRPRLKCAFTLFDGIPIDGLTDTVEELELMNELVGGEYWVEKSDGSLMQFKVKEIRNDLGQLRRIDISFPYRDESDRVGLMPMVVWLRSVVRQIKARKDAA